MWETLRWLKGISNLPWLVLGDFNETMWGYEHFSSTPRPERKMEEFRDTLSMCELYDISFCGLPYTWDNGHSGNANVRVHLDRAVADPAWRDAFDDASVRHLVSSQSDHCPILVELKKDSWEQKKTRIFRYEIMWVVW
jgi:endonuclease/exonuclease/phosphatase family metal-dependent hydrolase